MLHISPMPRWRIVFILLETQDQPEHRLKQLRIAWYATPSQRDHYRGFGMNFEHSSFSFDSQIRLRTREGSRAVMTQRRIDQVATSTFEQICSSSEVFTAAVRILIYCAGSCDSPALSRSSQSLCASRVLPRFSSSSHAPMSSPSSTHLLLLPQRSKERPTELFWASSESGPHRLEYLISFVRPVCRRNGKNSRCKAQTGALS